MTSLGLHSGLGIGKADRGWVGLGDASLGTARTVALLAGIRVQAPEGHPGRGESWRDVASQGTAVLGLACHGFGKAWTPDWQALRFEPGAGTPGPGEAWRGLGLARRGLARLGPVGYGAAWMVALLADTGGFESPGGTPTSGRWHGTARLGMAARGLTRLGLGKA